MLNRLRFFAGIASALTIFPLSAYAQSSCSSILSSVSSGFLALETARTNHPECFPTSGGGTNQQMIASTTLQQANSISNAVSARFNQLSSPNTSLSALPQVNLTAGNTQKFFIWGNRALNSTSYNTTVNSFDSRAHNRNIIIGGDYSLSPGVLIGLSAAFDSGDGYLRNGRALSTDAFDSKGSTIASYVGWQMSPSLALDAMLGLGSGDLVQRNAELDSKRRFAATNLTYTKWMGNFQISGKAGYFFATERFSDVRVNGMSPIADSATTARLNQVRIGGQAGYWISGGIMPYVGLAYSNDISRSASDAQPWDPIALVGTLGLNLIGVKQGIAGGIGYTNEFRREGTNNHTIGANLNVRF